MHLGARGTGLCYDFSLNSIIAAFLFGLMISNILVNTASNKLDATLTACTLPHCSTESSIRKLILPIWVSSLFFFFLKSVEQFVHGYYQFHQDGLSDSSPVRGPTRLMWCDIYTAPDANCHTERERGKPKSELVAGWFSDFQTKEWGSAATTMRRKKGTGVGT